MENSRKRVFGKSLVMLLTAIMLVAIVFSFIPKTTAHAAALTQEAEAIGTTQIVSDENVGYIGDPVVSPKWFTFEPLLGHTTKNDYTGTESQGAMSYYGKSLKYPNTGGSVVITSGYINEERYAINAKDSTGSTHRLVPVNGLGAANNIAATGSVTISVSKIADLIGTCVYSNDTIKMRNLRYDLAISGDSTKVATGKIMYRQSNTLGGWGGWSYVNLSTSATLTFSQTYVQIAVIYEVQEKGRFMLDIDDYTRIMGVYRFNIY